MKIKILTLVMILSLSISAFAQDLRTEGSRIIDNAGLLSAEQISNLEKEIAVTAETYNFDLVIVTERNIGGSDPREYADDFFDYNGYGLGSERNGGLFLHVTESREIYVSVSGTGIGIYNNTAADKLEADIVKFLRDDNPFEAYRSFLHNWEIFLALNAKGRSYNFFHRWNLVLVIGSWVLALLIGCAVVLAWKKKMNTALAKTQADVYSVPNSLVFKTKKDSLVYSNVAKTRRQTKSSGGSSLTTLSKHVSSSGRKHSGRGRKY